MQESCEILEMLVKAKKKERKKKKIQKHNIIENLQNYLQQLLIMTPTLGCPFYCLFFCCMV